MKYNYYFFNGLVYRSPKGEFLGRKEVNIAGLWVYDADKEIDLNDALMDFGDYSIMEVESITQQEAEKRVNIQL